MPLDLQPVEEESNVTLDLRPLRPVLDLQPVEESSDSRPRTPGALVQPENLPRDRAAEDMGKMISPDNRPRTPGALADSYSVNLDELAGKFTQESGIVVPQEAGTDEPIVGEDTILKALRILRTGSPIDNEYTRGAEKSLAKMASGMTTAKGIMAGSAAPFLPALIGSYFAGEGAKSFGELAGESTVDWNSLTKEQKGERAGDLILSGAVPASVLLHAASTAHQAVKAVDGVAIPPVIGNELAKIESEAGKRTTTDLTGPPGAVENAPTVAEQTKGVEPNASEIQKTTEVHGDVLDIQGAEESQRQVPVDESGQGVPTQTQEGVLNLGPEHGVGGAVPSEFERAADNPTAMKYRLIDQERVDRGLEPLLKPESRTDQETMDYAMARMDADPKLADRLVDKLNNNPSVIDDWENHVLLLTKIDLRRELQKTNDAINQFSDEGMPEMADSQRIRRAEINDRLQDVETASRASGSARGRALRALRVMANEDYSLAAMESDMRASHGGRRLTPEELSEVESMSKELQKTIAERDQAQAEVSQRIARSEVDKMLSEARAQAGKAANFSPGILARAEQLVKRLEDSDIVKAARERLKGKLLSPTPQDLIDLAVVGATHVARGAVELAKFTDEMIAEFGEGIRPYIQEIKNKADKFHDDFLKTTARADAPAIKRALKSKATVDEKVAADTAQVRAKFEAGDKASIHPEVNRIFRAMVEQDIARGIKIDRESLFDRVHGILKLFDPSITRQEAIDAISGRGIFTLPSQDVVSKTVRDLKTQARLIGHQMDVEAKKPLPRTGPQRDKMTNEARREQQKLNELKRKFGVVVTDAKAQLESVLGARKTYYRHRLADLKAEIAAKERTVKGKSPSPTDPELESLRKEYEQVKAEHEKIFGDRKLTDEQRAKMAESAAENNLKQWQAKLEDAKKGVFNGKKSAAKVSNAKIEAIRARTEAVKDEVQSLKDANASHQAELEAKRLNDRISEYEKKIKDGKVLPETKPAKPGAPVNDPLRVRLQVLRDTLSDMRDKSPEYQQKRADAALKLVEQSNEELARKINEGEIETKKKPGSSITSPELEAARAEHEQLAKIMQELRNAAKPRKTPEQIALQAAKTRATKRAAELLEKTAKGDFSTKPRSKIVPDRELIDKQLAVEKAKQAFEKAKEKARLEGRTWQERWRDNILKWRRQSLLSGVTSLFKLSSAAVERVGFTALEEGIGSALARVPGVKDIAERAPTEGKGSLQVEVTALHDAITKGMKDSWDTLRKGKSELDVLYGKTAKPESQMWEEFFGRLHGFLKAPVKRNAFERSLMKRMEFAARNGVDITDPLVQTRLSMEAYADANRSIFLQDNVASTALNMVTRYLEGKGIKSAPSIIRWFLPIVKVPTNIVAEAFTYAAGSVTGSAKVVQALRKGVSDLKPEEADLIMRQLKKGSLGAAVLVLGYLEADNIGGYYQSGTKQKKDAAKYGGLKIFGHDIPRFLVHNPLLEMLQLGATVRKVADSRLHKSDAEPQGIGQGVMAGLLGLVEEVPFVRSMVELAKAFDTRERGRFIGQNVKEAVVPRILQDAAEKMDQDAAGETVKRKPKSVTEYIETGIPGLRQNVPTK